jgi:phosphatidate cytidylyltransferase
MLRWRLILGTLIVAVLIGLCWLDARAAVPGVWLMPVVVLAAILGTQETLDLLAAAGLRPVRSIVHGVNLFEIVFPWLLWTKYHDAAGFSMNIWTIGGIAVPLFALFLAEIRRYRKPGESIANLAGGFLAWAYIGLTLSTAVTFRILAGIGVMAAWIIVVKMGDTGAYTVGRLFGRHKMSPLVSPGKTIEGAIGALAFSCLGSWFAFRWLVPSSVSSPWWGWIAFGLLVGAAGMLGDLAESLLKRDAGGKDSSRWMPGFGGALDVIDSLLLSAPVAWICWASGLVGR